MVINMYLLNCFFIYSILGFIVEGMFTLIISGHFSSGILYGPWTPIYGFGAILTIIISRKIFKKMHQNKFIETLITFIILMIILTIIEWLGGILIENLFHETLWNYKDYKYNIGKYISLEMSLIWGIISVFVIYFIKPIVDKLENKTPKFITIILIVLFIIDLFTTTVIKLK